MKQTFINIVEGAKTVPASTWKFLIAFALFTLNSVLTYFGVNPLPFSDSQVFEFLTNAVTVFFIFYGMWRNNSLTVNAQVADNILNALKAGTVTTEDVDKLVNK